MEPTTGIRGSSPSDRPAHGSVLWFMVCVSVAVHACVLFGLRSTFPIDWFINPLRTYHVELLLPPVEVPPGEDTPAPDRAEAPPRVDSMVPSQEDTISLDTKDEKYRPYTMLIKERLLVHWTYPDEARSRGIEGSVLVRFSLDRLGRVLDIAVLDPSAHDVLDRNAVSAINASAPFPPFPPSVTVSRLNIRASFTYSMGK